MAHSPSSEEVPVGEQQRGGGMNTGRQDTMLLVLMRFVVVVEEDLETPILPASGHLLPMSFESPLLSLQKFLAPKI